ncbi:potassium voltage-gated channel subfamily A member 10-like [Branchiostoma lanceolatum]|uniref:potassium voltage-gated channel subfamily A member 10-like n=1 Tax=Branchiostoma lanceolatum TaxID=7740 RepID=UPI0034559BB8
MARFVATIPVFSNHPYEEEQAEDIFGETFPFLHQAHDSVPGNPTEESFIIDMNRRICLNVSGLMFETREYILHRYPDTLLGDKERRQEFYCQDIDEYFIDRHRPSFEAIFRYYQTGKMTRPHSVPMDVFFNELKYFDMGQDVIENFLETDGCSQKVDPLEVDVLPESEPQRTIWIVFEYPQTSPLARFVALISISVIFVSIAAFCAETIPMYSEQNVLKFGQDDTLSDRLTMAYRSSFFRVETACIIWFCFELVIRFYACPDPKAFLKDILNILDLVAILPYFATHILIVANIQTSGSGALIMRILRVVRVFRICKLTRHITGMRLIIMTLLASMGSVILLVFFMSILMILFGSIVYFADMNHDESDFQSIPETFYWAVFTMTTVGYGDVYPRSLWGKLGGLMCVLCGFIVLAIPSPAIVANFNRFYLRHKNVLLSDEDIQQKEREMRKHRTLWDRFIKRFSKNDTQEERSTEDRAFRSSTQQK